MFVNPHGIVALKTLIPVKSSSNSSQNRFISSKPLASLDDRGHDAERSTVLALLGFFLGTDADFEFDFKWVKLDFNENSSSSSDDEITMAAFLLAFFIITGSVNYLILFRIPKTLKVRRQ